MGQLWGQPGSNLFFYIFFKQGYFDHFGVFHWDFTKSPNKWVILQTF